MAIHNLIFLSQGLFPSLTDAVSFLCSHNSLPFLNWHSLVCAQYSISSLYKLVLYPSPPPTVLIPLDRVYTYTHTTYISYRLANPGRSRNVLGGEDRSWERKRMFWMCRHDTRHLLAQVNGFWVNPDSDKASGRKKVFPTTDEGQKCEKKTMWTRKQMGDQCSQAKDVFANSIQWFYSPQEYPGLSELGKYQTMCTQRYYMSWKCDYLQIKPNGAKLDTSGCKTTQL